MYLIMKDWSDIYEFLQPKEPLFCPEKPSLTQKTYLRCSDMEALFGGAAGGGKSSALLMAALQYVDVPNYSAILFRRTYADLALPGALMDRFLSWTYGGFAFVNVISGCHDPMVEARPSHELRPWLILVGQFNEISNICQRPSCPIQ